MSNFSLVPRLPLNKPIPAPLPVPTGNGGARTLHALALNDCVRFAQDDRLTGDLVVGVLRPETVAGERLDTGDIGSCAIRTGIELGNGGAGERQGLYSWA